MSTCSVGLRSMSPKLSGVCMRDAMSAMLQGVPFCNMAHQASMLGDAIPVCVLEAHVGPYAVVSPLFRCIFDGAMCGLEHPGQGGMVGGEADAEMGKGRRWGAGGLVEREEGEGQPGGTCGSGGKCCVLCSCLCG